MSYKKIMYRLNGTNSYIFGNITFMDRIKNALSVIWEVKESKTPDDYSLKVIEGSEHFFMLE